MTLLLKPFTATSYFSFIPCLYPCSNPFVVVLMTAAYAKRFLGYCAVAIGLNAFN